MLKRRRFISLVYFVTCTLAAKAFAHALPDSTLLFIENNGKISIEIEMPLQELLNASPKFKSNMSNSIFAYELRSYLEQHLKVASNSGSLQKLEFVDYVKSTRKDDHVGTYDMVLAQLSISASDDFRLHEATLTTDIIMHQVANHSLILRWQNSAGVQHDIGRVSYDVLRKMVSPHVIVITQ